MVYRTTTLPPLFSLRREVDRLFDDAFGRANTATAPATWSPVTVVREEAEAFHFELELPGVTPEQVEISLEEGALSIRGERPARGSFKRTFQLPQTVAEDRITASFTNGLLSIVVPKEAPKTRRIEITK